MAAGVASLPTSNPDDERALCMRVLLEPSGDTYVRARALSVSTALGSMSVSATRTSDTGSATRTRSSDTEAAVLREVRLRRGAIIEATADMLRALLEDIMQGAMDILRDEFSP
jgi:hypothetical protein